jgi:hypothetical protein
MTKPNVRTERIELRASPEEKSEIERRAGSVGVGAFLRQRALDEWSPGPRAAESRHAESQPTERTESPALPPADEIEALARKLYGQGMTQGRARITAIKQLSS